MTKVLHEESMKHLGCLKQHLRFCIFFLTTTILAQRVWHLSCQNLEQRMGENH